MQPLDVSVFAPMKRRWRLILNIWKEDQEDKEESQEVYTCIPKQVNKLEIP
jgi:hypothetical protein